LKIKTLGIFMVSAAPSCFNLKMLKTEPYGTSWGFQSAANLIWKNYISRLGTTGKDRDRWSFPVVAFPVRQGQGGLLRVGLAGLKGRNRENCPAPGKRPDSGQFFFCGANAASKS